jgi:hypothetical protein
VNEGCLPGPAPAPHTLSPKDTRDSAQFVHPIKLRAFLGFLVCFLILTNLFF